MTPLKSLNFSNGPITNRTKNPKTSPIPTSLSCTEAQPFDNKKPLIMKTTPNSWTYNFSSPKSITNSKKSHKLTTFQSTKTCSIVPESMKIHLTPCSKPLPNTKLPFRPSWIKFNWNSKIKDKNTLRKYMLSNKITTSRIKTKLIKSENSWNKNKCKSSPLENSCLKFSQPKQKY